MAKTAGGRRNKEKKKAIHKQQEQDSDLRKKGLHDEAKRIRGGRGADKEGGKIGDGIVPGKPGKGSLRT